MDGFFGTFEVSFRATREMFDVFFGANANTVDAIIVLRSIEVANDVDVTVGMSGLVDVRVKHS